MKTLLQILVLMAAISSGSNQLMAQWVQTSGPEGGQITSIVNIDTYLFAGSWGGVFRSENNGTTWTPVNNGLVTNGVSCLAVIGTNLFAGTNGAGVYRSTNNGLNWTSANTGLTNGGVSSLFAFGTILFAGTQGGVFRSSDNGANWTEVNNGLTNTYVRALAVSGAYLFAGTYGGVFRSTNNGENWIEVNTGLTNTDVRALAVKDTNLFAGTWAGGIFRSTNNGENWIEVNSGLTVMDKVIRAFVVSDTNIFAGTEGVGGVGVVRSTNNGANWIPANTGLTNTGVFALYVNNSSLFAGTNGGVYRSMDNGALWTEVNSGMKNVPVLALAISGTNLLASAWGSGIFRSSDGGDSWVSSIKHGMFFSFTSNYMYLFAGTGGGVFRSTDNGVTWTSSGGLPNVVSALAVNGTDLFAGTGLNGTGEGVFRSSDNGANWDTVNIGLTNLDVRALAVSGAYLFAGTGGGVFRSTNNGDDWIPINSGLTNTDVNALAVSGTYLFAGTWGGGIFRSTITDTNWTEVNNGLLFADVRTFAVSDTFLFAGGWYVAWSTNNGDSWTNYGSGMGGTRQVNALAVSGTDIFAGKRGSSVWRRDLPTITSVESFSSERPLHFSLEQNYPNPFNPTTIIKYQIPELSFVTIKVYDVLGGEIAIIVNEEKSVGSYEVEFNSHSGSVLNLPSGIYFYRLQVYPANGGAGSFVETKKMILIK